MNTTTTSATPLNTTSTSKPFALPVTTPEKSGVKWNPLRNLEQPLHWRNPRIVGIPSDLFHVDVPDEYIDKAFAVMERAKQHTFQILTKRPSRMRDFMKTWILRKTVEREEDQTLWGQTQKGTPRLVSAVLGNGQQIISFATLDCRPNYYVVRVDSFWNLDNDADGELLIDHTDEIYEAIENEFGSVECHSCGELFGSETPCSECEDEPAHGWPALDDSTGGCSWYTYRPNYVDPLSNVWLGVTVENQHFADERIPILLETPAAVRFISAEPLLEKISLKRWLFTTKGGRPCTCGNKYFHRDDCHVWEPTPLSWVIIGGESGPRHRAFDPAWARQLVAECRVGGAAAFVKQLGGHHPGSKLEDLPEDLRVREFPR